MHNVIGDVVVGSMIMTTTTTTTTTMMMMMMMMMMTILIRRVLSATEFALKGMGMPLPSHIKRGHIKDAINVPYESMFQPSDEMYSQLLDRERLRQGVVPAEHLIHIRVGNRYYTSKNLHTAKIPTMY